MNKPTIKLIGTRKNMFSLMADVKETLENNGKEKEAKEFMEEITKKIQNCILLVADDYVTII